MIREFGIHPSLYITELVVVFYTGDGAFRVFHIPKSIIPHGCELTVVNGPSDRMAGRSRQSHI